MITIVSLAWNQSDITRSFLQRLKRYTDIPYKLVFTDNGSIEPISSIVKEEEPNVFLIQKESNIGCPRTRNEAMSYVDTDITFWIDNDVMLGPGWYKPIMKALEDESVGISGPFGYIVKNPWKLPNPFEPTLAGDCDFFMGYLMGFKTKYFKPINDYNIPVNLDDVELCFGIKENGKRAVVSGPCSAYHMTSQTKRGWEFNNEEKLEEMWKNWPNKKIFEEWS